MIKNNQGFTIVEVLISVMVLAISIYAISGISNILSRLEGQTNQVQTSTHRITQAIAAIRSSPHSLQKNFDLTTSANQELLVEKLPIGYTETYWGDRSGCEPSCAGYLGFVVKPLLTNKGLFEVTIRDYNKAKDESTDLVLLLHSN